RMIVRKPSAARLPLPTTRSPRMPAGTANCWPQELPELAELVVEGLDIAITGFAPVEIDQLTADFEDDPADPADTVDFRWSTAAAVTRPTALLQVGVDRHVAAVAGGHDAAFIDQDRHQKPECRDAVGNLANLLPRVRSRVTRIRLERIDCDPFNRAAAKLL